MGMHMRVRTSARLRMRIPAQIHTYEGARPRALPEGLGFPVEKIEDMSAGEAEEHIAALYGDELYGLELDGEVSGEGAMRCACSPVHDEVRGICDMLGLDFTRVDRIATGRAGMLWAGEGMPHRFDACFEIRALARRLRTARPEKEWRTEMRIPARAAGPLVAMAIAAASFGCIAPAAYAENATAAVISDDGDHVVVDVDLNGSAPVGDATEQADMKSSQGESVSDAEPDEALKAFEALMTANDIIIRSAFTTSYCRLSSRWPCLSSYTNCWSYMIAAAFESRRLD